jgi:hypothetical protein
MNERRASCSNGPAVERRVDPSSNGCHPPPPRNGVAALPSALLILGLKLDVVYARAVKASRT